jgi:RNA-directed DNA polymerase
VRQAARQSKEVRFTALLHHITIDLLKRCYIALKRDAAPGIDGVTWRTYGENLDEKLKDLHERIHRGSYRARPARRTYIPKADGTQRPLSVWCLEDKIVQSDFPMASGRGVASMMRWTRSMSVSSGNA